MDELRNKYSELDLLSRRKILMDEMLELCLLFERICKNKGIDIDKISNDDILLNRNNISEGESLNYMFTYLLNLKEDLSKIL